MDQEEKGMAQGKDPGEEPMSTAGTMPQADAPRNASPQPVTRPQTLQPSLVKKEETVTRKLPLPRSFLLAVITILVTIIAGVAIARYLGRMTQRGPLTESLPQITPVEQSLEEPVENESTPSPLEDPGRFDELLNLEENEEATPASPVIGPKVATSSP